MRFALSFLLLVNLSSPATGITSEKLVEVCQNDMVAYASGDKTWLARRTASLSEREAWWMQKACDLYASGLRDGMKTAIEWFEPKEKK